MLAGPPWRRVLGSAPLAWRRTERRHAELAMVPSGPSRPRIVQLAVQLRGCARRAPSPPFSLRHGRAPLGLLAQGAARLRAGWRLRGLRHRAAPRSPLVLLYQSACKGLSPSLVGVGLPLVSVGSQRRSVHSAPRSPLPIEREPSPLPAQRYLREL